MFLGLCYVGYSIESAYPEFSKNNLFGILATRLFVDILGPTYRWSFTLAYLMASFITIGVIEALKEIIKSRQQMFETQECTEEQQKVALMHNKTQIV